MGFGQTVGLVRQAGYDCDWTISKGDERYISKSGGVRVNLWENRSLRRWRRQFNRFPHVGYNRVDEQHNRKPVLPCRLEGEDCRLITVIDGSGRDHYGGPIAMTSKVCLHDIALRGQRRQTCGGATSLGIDNDAWGCVIEALPRLPRSPPPLR